MRKQFSPPMKLKKRSREISSARMTPDDYPSEGQLSDAELCAALEQALRRAAELLAEHQETSESFRLPNCHAVVALLR